MQLSIIVLFLITCVLMPQKEAVYSMDPKDIGSGISLPKSLATMNAYLG